MDKDVNNKEVETVENDEEGKFNFIMSPVKGDSSFPLMLVLTATRTYIGGYSPSEDENEVILNHPLLMFEVPTGQQGGQQQITLAMRKVVNNLEVMETLPVRYESFAFMDGDKPTNKRVATMYGVEIERYTAVDSDIVLPSAEDVANINRGVKN
jgi:hypothetical protein